jgi:O-6-methylguanine DNA methyltransferase
LSGKSRSAVASYTDIAVKLDMPHAGRSVGAAIGRNPLLIFVPDHRVINRGGSVGGFAENGIESRDYLIWKSG